MCLNQVTVYALILSLFLLETSSAFHLEYEDGLANRRANGVRVSDEPEVELQGPHQHLDIRQAIEPSAACSNRWPDGKVLYRFDLTEHPLAENYRKRLKEAMDRWAKLSCLTFTDIGNDPSRWNETHIYVENLKGKACSTLIGLVCGAQGQMMNLGRSCGTVPVFMHEIGHALGLFHMHTRTDRDQHVKIQWKNIALTELEEFKIEESETFGTPYDFMSIMHYGKKTFSKGRRLPTVETIDPLKQYLIGNPPEPSHYDLAIVNKMYTCSRKCTNIPVCENGGFVDKSCNCVCPHNCKGKFCEIVIAEYFSPVYDKCGKQLIYEDTVITSLGYPGRHPNEKCMWYLEAPKGKKAQITFDDFHLYPHRKCRIDYVYVMHDLYTEKQRFCGASLKGKTITAKDHSLVLFWRTGYKYGKTGFSASVKFIDDLDNKAKEANMSVDKSKGQQSQKPNPNHGEQKNHPNPPLQQNQPKKNRPKPVNQQNQPKKNHPKLSNQQNQPKKNSSKQTPQQNQPKKNTSKQPPQQNQPKKNHPKLSNQQNQPKKNSSKQSPQKSAKEESIKTASSQKSAKGESSKAIKSAKEE